MRLSATVRAGDRPGRRVALHWEQIPGSAVRLFRHEDPETGSFCAVCGYVVDPGWYRDDDPGRGAREVYETYRRRGAEAAFDRNGVYAILIDDPTTGTVHCAVDKKGFFPLFHAAGGPGLLLDTDFAALKQQVACTADYDGIEEYLAVGHPCADRTFFKEIKRIEPGRYVRIDGNGAVASGRYWWYDRLEYVGSRDLESSVKENLEAFEASIADFRRIVRDPICLLSSGYDSRRILLELRRQGVVPRTYTVEILDKNFDEPVSIEDAVARSLLPAGSALHTSVPVPDCADMARLIEVRERILGGQADEHAWVMPLRDIIPHGSGTNFDGLGGDTLCNSDLAICGTDVARRYGEPDFLAAFWRNHLSPYLSGALRSRFGGTLHERVRAMITDLPENPNRVFLLELVGRSRRTTSLFALSLLAGKVDSVFPYLDDRVVAAALRAEPFWKREVDFQKVLLDRAYPEFRHVPSSHSRRGTVEASYRKPVTHLFGGLPAPAVPARTSRFSPQLRHALGGRPRRGARPRCLNARGEIIVAAARVAAALDLDVRLARAAFERLWGVPRLLKLERILSSCR